MQHLTQVPIFRELQQAHLAALSRHAKKVIKRNGDAVILEGEKMIGVHVVTSGAVAIFPKGQKSSVATLNAGEAIGETVLIHDHAATVSVRAAADGTELLLIPKQSFEDLFKTDPTLPTSLYKGIAATLAERLRASNAKMREFMSKGTTAAFPSAAEILSKTEETLSLGRDGAKVDSNLTTGIIESLGDLVAKVGAPEAEVLKSIAYDVSLLRDREQACIAAFSAQISEMRDVIMKMMQMLQASD